MRKFFKNFLLHTLPKLRKQKARRFLPFVQLDLIEDKISYSKDVIQSATFRDYEVDYLNEFHKENNQPLIWIKESLYKAEIRKKRLTN
tara:strand:- start:1280 stop:1543 length:264 start_codon:yes stop_codon:yes gene_type:complete